MLVYQDAEEAAQAVYQHVLAARKVAELGNERFSMLIPTGGTFVPFYRLLEEACQSGEFLLSDLVLASLDEYDWSSLKGTPLTGRLDAYAQYGYLTYHAEQNFKSINAVSEAGRWIIPYGAADDQQLECKRCTQLLQVNGRFDVALIGSGTNGHGAFNEPANGIFNQPIGYELVELSEETKKNNAQWCGGKTPERAYSVTMQTLAWAKQKLILITGEAKADIVKAMYYRLGPTEEIPLTYLTMGEHAKGTIVFLDEAAASKLPQ